MPSLKARKTVVLDVVGLTREHISPETTPRIDAFLNSGSSKLREIDPAFPALTCTAQASYLTGLPPSQHGAVANGWFDKTYCEYRNWHQSSKLLMAPRLFRKIKEADPSATVFMNCWWFCMYDEDVDYAVTPRPQYLTNGGKLPDCYTKPTPLRDELQSRLGKFPLHKFWGPTTSVQSSQWIADATMIVDEKYDPTLTLVYLPHLDYGLQKFGPDNPTEIPSDLRQIDGVVGQLIDYYSAKRANVVILSEYGIGPVSEPIHINRVLREHGYIVTRRENYGETLDCGASPAFALADHQVAHVYVQRKGDIPAVKELLESIPGVDVALTAKEQGESYNPERSGDLLAVAKENYWFTYYYWPAEKWRSSAPDFAYTVAIHRKPGYDPAEMFFRFPNLPNWLGFLYLIFKFFVVYVLHIRTIVDGTPLDSGAVLIRGSHGRGGPVGVDKRFRPVVIAEKGMGTAPVMKAVGVYDVILKTVLSK
ncbi:type I phosphodiesterase/nucleotide pyrophosphatase [Hyaloraphidium curvatum]|nr:type I phosphodiesterase/nucleotide pyrophosphatase [Hyaloraphidium curvatum]